MYCGKCGTQLDDGVQTCPSCGSSQSKGSTYNASDTGELPVTNSETNQNRNDATYTPGYAPPYPPPPMQHVAEPVSALRWFGRLLIPWIPFVGGLVNLIMLIVWACSNRFEETSKNWAIANLIVTIIGITLSLILGIALYSFIYSLFSDPSFQRDLQLYLNGIY